MGLSDVRLSLFLCFLTFLSLLSFLSQPVLLSHRQKQRYGFHLCVNLPPPSLHHSFHSSLTPICVFLISGDMTVTASGTSPSDRISPTKHPNIFSLPPSSPRALNIPFSHYGSLFPPLSSLALFSFSFVHSFLCLYCPLEFPRPV